MNSSPRCFFCTILFSSVFFLNLACTRVTSPLGEDYRSQGIADADRYLASGTLIISHKIPARPLTSAYNLAVQGENGPELMSPLIGYFPPQLAYLSADNEPWLEIFRDSKRLVLHRGNVMVKEIQGDGVVDLPPGEYYLQHPEKDPLWYAPDDYFKKRKLKVPAQGDRMRYRRGALGKYALYVTTTFPIHCGPVWVDDVGGLRISSSELTSVFHMLPRGTAVIVR